jgi:hypothetical protein
MSDKAKGRAWELALPHPLKYVLLAMLDHADHLGRNMYPGYDLIAYKTDYHEKTVNRLVRELQALGILQLDDPARNPSPSNPFHVNWSACTFKPEFIREVRGRPKRSHDSLPVFPKRGNDRPEKRESPAPKEVTIEQKEVVRDDPTRHDPTPITINQLEIREPRGLILPLPRKMEFNPSGFHDCAYPGCFVQTTYPYCYDHGQPPAYTRLKPKYK